MVFSQIMTAREASLKLGKNEKYIYLLWKNNSNILLKGSLEMKGSTLLITKEGYEYLKPLVKKEKDQVINLTNYMVYEVIAALLSPKKLYYQ